MTYFKHKWWKMTQVVEETCAIAIRTQYMRAKGANNRDTETWSGIESQKVLVGEV